MNGASFLNKTVAFVAAVAAIFLMVGLAVTWRLAATADWNDADVSLLVWLLPLGAGSYLLRFLRWHTLARQLAPRLAFGASLRTYMAGFAMGLTPGRVGELCKFTLLRQESGVPEAQSAPVFILERATEAASFAALVVAGAGIGGFQVTHLGAGSVAAIATIPGLALAALAARLVARRKRQAPRGSTVQQLLHGVQSVAGPGPVLAAICCALCARFFDVVLFWTALKATGAELPLAAAALAFGLAGLSGGLSLLPAGVGAVEASLVATVAALGAPAGYALLAALLARCVTLWVWIPAGLWFAFRGTCRPAYASRSMAMSPEVPA